MFKAKCKKRVHTKSIKTRFDTERIHRFFQGEKVAYFSKVSNCKKHLQTLLEQSLTGVFEIPPAMPVDIYLRSMLLKFDFLYSEGVRLQYFLNIFSKYDLSVYPSLKAISWIGTSVYERR